MRRPWVSDAHPLEGALGRLFRRALALAGGWTVSRTSLRRLAATAFLATLVVLGPGVAQAEKRIALVIGNGSYRELKSLPNPRNDAGDVAGALKGLGFEVITGADLDQAGMQGLIARFVREAREADVSLLYYSGHGFQLASQNYLVPVDAALRTADDVVRKTIDLRGLIEQLEGSKGIHLVFLDACRNNPFAGKADLTGLQNGLARVSHAAGFLIAFATQPDNIAFDGGARNSPFTQAILSHLSTRGQDVASMMIAVRKDVLAATGGYQVPWENSRSPGNSPSRPVPRRRPRPRLSSGSSPPAPAIPRSCASISIAIPRASIGRTPASSSPRCPTRAYRAAPRRAIRSRRTRSGIWRSAAACDPSSSSTSRAIRTAATRTKRANC